MIEETKKTNQTGKIVTLFSGVAKVAGLENVFLNEVLLDTDDIEVALVIGFDEEYVEALFFDEYFDISKKIFRSNRLFSIAISESIIGRVVNGFGKGVDGFGKVKGKESDIFSIAPAIIHRKKVTRPLITGIKIIDTTLPLGRGQRELIIGDRKTGKSTIAEDIVLNQKNNTEMVYCVYVLIGQKEQKIKETIALFEKKNAFLYTTVVAVPADASFAEIYLAPFVGTAIAEYFRDKGDDSLIIYDDLSKHAKTYRDISLLMERTPGREVYPSDMFSLHAQLLERSAQLSNKEGGGSMTALPIIETQENDITAYIPTNIISITDGQIYLENDLFQKGFLPAVNVGLSVSRIGSAVQPRLLKETIGSIRLSLAQHRELQKLSQLETSVSQNAITKINRGSLILEILKQDKNEKVDWMEQVVLFYIIEKGFFDDLKKEHEKKFEKLFLKLLRNKYSNLLEEIKGGVFDKNTKITIRKIVVDFKNEFMSNDEL